MDDKSFLTIKIILTGCLIWFISACAAPEPTSSAPTLEPAATFTPETKLSGVELGIQELGAHYSQETLIGYIEDLTAIQPFSGWRNSASEGEVEALDYITGTLDEFSYLKSLGLELERQKFSVFLATEIWESRLFLTLGDLEIEVPVNAISAHREKIGEALRFDSDGTLNDKNRDPLEVSGSSLLIRSGDDIVNLPGEDIQGKTIFIDFRVVEPRSREDNPGPEIISALIEKGAAAIVLVTESPGGKYAGAGTKLEGIKGDARIPMIYLRIEDLKPAGIDSWDGLALVEGARLIWDVDVFSPGTSGNLAARIPGKDTSRAVILGAHIDSANTPGATDNALNAAVLLEMARVLNEAAFQPPADIYLVWFGSEELGFFGSQHFVNTHQELLDRALAAFLMDGFTADEDGPAILAMQECSFARLGDTRIPFAEYLEEKGALFQIMFEFVVDSPVFASDDGPFYGFVPQVRFAFGSSRMGMAFHGPYDTIDLLDDEAEVMENSLVMSLIAAIATPQDAPDMRVAPDPGGRALILATHTEALHMTPPMMLNLVQALTWQGFDVDVMPYGQMPTPEDLAGADLVLALPVFDYAAADNYLAQSDEGWLEDEIDMLEDYVGRGGFLVLTNSANRLFMRSILDPNEDWEKVNALAGRFGVHYEGDPFPITAIPIVGSHPITDFRGGLEVLPKNGIPFSIQEGELLAVWQDKAGLALVEVGEEGGQVLVLADLGSFDLYNFDDENDINQAFLRNLAVYTWER